MFSTGRLHPRLHIVMVIEVHFGTAPLFSYWETLISTKISRLLLHYRVGIERLPPVTLKSVGYALYLTVQTESW